MIGSNENNVQLMLHVARHLGDLVEDVVFVGGCVVGLLIDEQGAPEVRSTTDVDLVVELVSRTEYYELEGKLRSLGPDLEDIVAVIDGREGLVEEIGKSEERLRIFLSDSLRRLFQDRRFREALPGHLPSDEASQARAPMVLRRLREIIQIGRPQK